MVQLDVLNNAVTFFKQRSNIFPKPYTNITTEPYTLNPKPCVKVDSERVESLMQTWRERRLCF